MFDTYGHCLFGILCRFGQSHIDPQTGHNIIVTKSNQNYIESLNKYPPLLKHLLRRKKYDYRLSDRLIKIANKEITKANIIKRNNPLNEQHHDDKDIGEKEDRSLVDIYYSALQKVNLIRSNALINFKNSCGESCFCWENIFSNRDFILSYSFVHVDDDIA